MDIIEWSEKFSVGDRLMDSYHHIFFEMVKEFVMEAEQGTLKDESLRDCIRFLVRYVAMHFRAEERLMEQCGYPGRAEHRILHREFAGEIQEMAARFEVHPESLPAQEVLFKAMLWFARHILGEDMKYKAFL